MLVDEWQIGIKLCVLGGLCVKKESDSTSRLEASGLRASRKWRRQSQVLLKSDGRSSQVLRILSIAYAKQPIPRNRKRKTFTAFGALWVCLAVAGFASGKFKSNPGNRYVLKACPWHCSGT